MRDLIAFKNELDTITSQAEINNRIKAKISELKRLGLSNEEILQIFRIEKITEAQGNAEMIRNHQEYVKMVQQILAKKQ